MCNILILVFWGSFHSTAQDSTTIGSPNKGMDSLRRVINSTSHDTSRIKALIQLSESLRNKNLDSSLTYLQDAIYLASSLKDSTRGKLQEKATGLLATSYLESGISKKEQGRFPEALRYYRKALPHFEEVGDLKGKARVYGSLGNIYSERGRYAKSLTYYFKAAKIFDKLQIKEKQAAILVNIGVNYLYQNNNGKALEYYKKALERYKELKDTNSINFLNRNIGQLHYRGKEYDKALEYFHRALTIDKRLDHTNGIRGDYHFLGKAHTGKEEYIKAMDFYNRSLELSVKMGGKRALAILHSSRGELYLEMYQKEAPDTVLEKIIPEALRAGRRILLDSALHLEKKAHSLYRELNFKTEVSNSHERLGDIYKAMRKPDKAIEHYRKAYDLAVDISDLSPIPNITHKLYITYKEQKNNTNRALFWHEKHLTFKDSLFNKEKQLKMGRLEAEHEWKKKQLKDSLQHSKNMREQRLKHQHEVEQQRTYTYVVIGGLIMMVLIALVLFRSYRQKQRSNSWLQEKNRIIHQQKVKVEEKNKEVMASINYARYLQQAIFPSRKKLERLLPEHFVLLKPQEKVSGDFYWVEQTADKVFFTVADCTGHGVPGAMVSVIGNEALNRCLREFSLHDPAAILNKLTELVEESFASSDQEMSDGMDMGLCVWDPNKNELNFSGANNPLYLISSSPPELPEGSYKEHHFEKADKKFYEIRPNKQPIGKFAAREPFRSVKLELHKGDTLYLFSDGYPDQLGGPKGKKFKQKQFREVLMELQGHSMKDQKQKLDEIIESWMKADNEEQIDDICVMGMRV